LPRLCRKNRSWRAAASFDVRVDINLGLTPFAHPVFDVIDFLRALRSFVRFILTDAFDFRFCVPFACLFVSLPFVSCRLIEITHRSLAFAALTTRDASRRARSAHFVVCKTIFVVQVGIFYLQIIDFCAHKDTFWRMRWRRHRPHLHHHHHHHRRRCHRLQTPRSMPLRARQIDKRVCVCSVNIDLHSFDHYQFNSIEIRTLVARFLPMTRQLLITSESVSFLSSVKLGSVRLFVCFIVCAYLFNFLVFFVVRSALVLRHRE
jgi:hypothetical protein